MKKYVKFVGLAILGLMLWRVDLGAVGLILKSCRVELVLAAFGLLLVALGLKVARWQQMLLDQGVSYPFRRALLVYMTGIYIGLVTPGRLGELSRVMYLRRDTGMTVGMGLSSIVFDRLFDFYALLLVGLVALVRFGLNGYNDMVWVAALLFFLGPLVLLNPRLGRWFTSQLLAKALRRKFASTFTNEIDEFFKGIERLRSPRLILSAMLTALFYLGLFSVAYVLAGAAGIDIGFGDSALTLGLANLLALLPITVAGVGTRDAVFVFAFEKLDLSSAAALAFSTLILVVVYLGTGLAAFLCFWMVSRDSNNASVERSAAQSAVDHVGDHADGEDL